MAVFHFGASGRQDRDRKAGSRATNAGHLHRSDRWIFADPSDALCQSGTVESLALEGTIDRAEGRATDVLRTAEVGLEGIRSQAIGPKAPLEGVHRRRVDSLGGVVEGAHPIQPNTLELGVRGPGGQNEAEVRRPGDRGSGLGQSAQP